METGQRLLYIVMFVMENGRGWMAVKRQPFAGFVNNQNTLCASVHEAMTLYQRFQTEVEEDISNRFKMLDISNRFKIGDFKYILNVDL